MSKAKTTPALPTLAEIATIERDLARCDRKRDIWLSWSDRHETLRYDVTHHQDTDTWACNCPATGPCKHIRRCQVVEAVLWWERLLHAASPAELRALLPTKRQQVRLDVDALSAHGAILAIRALLLAADESDEEEAA